MTKMLIFILLFVGTALKANAQKDSLSVDSLSEQQDSIWRNVQVKEVMIKGNRIVGKQDKEIWTITDEMRQHTFSTFDIIGKIDDFYYDRIEKKMYFQNSDNVLLLIDGKIQDDNYIGNLANVRFNKIEVIRHPLGRYNGYDAVINVITKEEWTGHEIDITTSSTVKPFSEYDNFLTGAVPSVSYTYARPQFAIAAFYGLRYRNNHRKSSLCKKMYDGIMMSSVAEDKATESSRYNNNNMWIDADYNINKNHSLSLKLAYNTTLYDTWNGYLMSSTATKGQLYRRSTDSDNNNHSFTLSAYYRGKVWNTEIDSYFAYNGVSGYTDYTYQETSGFQTTTEQRNNRNFTDLGINSNTQIKNYLLLSAGYQNYRRWSESNIQNKRTTNGLDRNRGYLALDYGIIKNLSAKFSGAFEFIKTSSSETETEHHLLWETGMKLNYRFHHGKYSLSFDYHANTVYPLVYQTNSIERKIDSILTIKGNPLLKPSTAHNIILGGKFNFIRLEGKMEFVNNKISSVYQQTPERIFLTYDNIKQTNLVLRASANKYFQLSLKNFLSFNAHIEYNQSRVWSSDIDENTSFWTGGFFIYYTSNSSFAMFSLDKKCTNSLSAYTISQTGFDHWTILLGHYYLNKRIEASISWYLPISWLIKKNFYEKTTTPYYENNYQYERYNSEKNRIEISVSYKFVKGHKIRKRRYYQREETEEYDIHE